MPWNTAPIGGRRSLTISLALSVSNRCFFTLQRHVGWLAVEKIFSTATPCTAIIQFLEVLKFVIKNKASSGEQQQQFIIKAKQKAKLDLKRKRFEPTCCKRKTRQASKKMPTRTLKLRAKIAGEVESEFHKLNLYFFPLESECLEKKREI